MATAGCCSSPTCMRAQAALSPPAPPGLNNRMSATCGTWHGPEWCQRMQGKQLGQHPAGSGRPGGWAAAGENPAQQAGTRRHLPPALAFLYVLGPLRIRELGSSRAACGAGAGMLGPEKGAAVESRVNAVERRRWAWTRTNMHGAKSRHEAARRFLLNLSASVGAHGYSPRQRQHPTAEGLGGNPDSNQECNLPGSNSGPGRQHFRNNA